MRPAEYFQSAYHENRLQLLTQPIVSVPPADIERSEVLTCIWDGSKQVAAGEWIQSICQYPEAMQCLDLNTLLTLLSEPRPGEYWVNFSALSLQDPWFMDGVAEAIAASRWHPSQLMFEVTEYCPLTGDVLTACRALRALGCGLALDDFGAGYSTATHLVELPVTALKIDQYLCQQALHQVKAYQVVRSFIQMGQAMDLLIVAEGVQTPEQQQLLTHLGVSHFQGWLFGRPHPLGERSARIERSDDPREVRAT